MKFIRQEKRNPSDEPTSGAWYMVPLKNGWEIFTWYGDFGHVRQWPRSIVPLLKKAYGLSATETLMIMDLPYSLPRGRVAVFEGQAYMAHGDDFPKGTDTEQALRYLISEFGLNAMQVSGRLHIQFDKHETMFPEEKKALQHVIGKVKF